MEVIENIGGEYENRTRVHGFAIRCVTTPPTRLNVVTRVLHDIGVGCKRCCVDIHATPHSAVRLRGGLSVALPTLLWHDGLNATSAPGLIMQDFTALRTMMVDTQVRPQDVTKFNIIEAMLSVAREAYFPDALRDVAYVGENATFEGGRVVLEPRTMGKILDALDVQPDELVLDLGCGLGYSSAVLAHLAEAVVAIEDVPALAAEAQDNLGDQGVDNVAVIEGSLASGSAKHGPYDVICIEGGVEDVPAAILDQLKDGGRIAAIFMTGALGECRIGHKLDGRVHWRMAFNAAASVLPGFEKEAGFVL